MTAARCAFSKEETFRRLIFLYFSNICVQGIVMGETRPQFLTTTNTFLPISLEYQSCYVLREREREVEVFLFHMYNAENGGNDGAIPYLGPARIQAFALLSLRLGTTVLHGCLPFSTLSPHSRHLAFHEHVLAASSISGVILIRMMSKSESKVL